MKSKLAIVDARCKEEILLRLADYAEKVFPFRSEGITYESISCHPDIFIYQDPSHIIVAPNSPQLLTDALHQNKIAFQKGDSSIGSLLIDSCYYNCLATERHFFHRKGFTETTICDINRFKSFVALPQSYTRCSMFALNANSFITSDAGIDKALKSHGFETFLFNPSEIKIAVHKHGFLGGTCGRWKDKVLFLGNPLAHADGKALCQFIEKNGLEATSLCNGHLYDGGGIFFVD